MIDEADLVFALGYEEDTKSLVQHFPKIFQVRVRRAKGRERRAENGMWRTESGEL